MHCVGCGNKISWDGTGILCYTCPCEGTLFADDTQGKIAIPASLVMAALSKRNLPHINYYLGCSNYTSAEKGAVVDRLKQLGATWAWECDECRLRFAMRMMMHVQEGLYRFELHPELKMMIETKLPAEFKLLNQSAGPKSKNPKTVNG